LAVAIHAQVLVRVAGIAGPVNTLLTAGDEVWAGTDDGVYSVDCKSARAVRVAGEMGRVSDIEQPQFDSLWVSTSKGLFRIALKTNRSELIRGIDVPISGAVVVGTEVWLKSEKGAYWVGENAKQVVPLDADTGAVTSIFKDGDFVWLKSSKGLFRVVIGSHRAEPAVGVLGKIEFTEFSGDRILLTTEKGEFQIPKGSLQAIQNERARDLEAFQVGSQAGKVLWRTLVGQDIWIGTDHGVFWQDPTTKQAMPLAGFQGEASSFLQVDGTLWLKGSNGVFRADPKTHTFVEITGVHGRVRWLIQSGGEIWINGEDGTFRVDPNTNRAEAYGGAEEKAFDVLPWGDTFLSSGLSDFYQLDIKKKTTKLLIKDLHWSSWSTYNGGLLICSKDGLFWLDFESDLRASLSGTIPFSERLLGHALWFSGEHRMVVDYVRKDARKSNYSTGRAYPIQVLYDTNLDALKRKITEPGAWIALSANAPAVQLNSGIANIFVAVQDSWGNKTDATSIRQIEGTVLPIWTLWLMTLSAVVCVLLVGAIPVVMIRQRVLLMRSRI